MSMANEMCVVVVTTFFPNAQKPHRTVFLRNLAIAMQNQGEIAVVAPLPYPKRPWDRKAGTPITAIAAREVVGGLDVHHPKYLSIPGLSAISGIAYFFGIFLTVRRLCRWQAVPVLHAHCAFPDAVGVALVAKALRIPYVVTVHGSDINFHANVLFLRPQIRWALLGARGVVCVSAPLAKKVAKIVQGRVPIREIPCAGYSPQTFYPGSRDAARAKLGLSGRERIVLFVGNLVPVKAVSILILAWKDLLARNGLTNFKLIIVGDGPLYLSLQLEASEKCGESVHFTGPLSQVAIANWMRAANILCLPSLSEGMPNVLVEALACGLPVVATNVGGVPDLIIDDSLGFLVQPGNSADLSRSIEMALGRDWIISKLVEAVSKFDWDSLALQNWDFIRATVIDRETGIAGRR